MAGKIYSSKEQWEKENNYGFISIDSTDMVDVKWYSTKKAAENDDRNTFAKGFILTRKQFGAFLKQHPELRR